MHAGSSRNRVKASQLWLLRGCEAHRPAAQLLLYSTASTLLIQAVPIPLLESLLQFRYLGWLRQF